jgi:hypothetical protein
MEHEAWATPQMKLEVELPVGLMGRRVEHLGLLSL